MMLAGTFEASDGGPTVLLYLIVAAVSLAAAISVLVGLRRHDKRQLEHLREKRAEAEKPWLRMIVSNSKRLARVERGVDQILDVAAQECPDQFSRRPDLRLVKGG